MSRYELGRLFFDACRDREMKLAARYRKDPQPVLDEYRLSDAERQYLLDADIRAIYESGVPPLLVRMGINTLVGGIEFDERFLESVRLREGSKLAELSHEDLARAGNGTHEIRNWLCVMAAVGDVPADFVVYEPVEG